MLWRRRGGSRRGSIGKACCIPRFRPVACVVGAILLYGIPKVVVGENETFLGEEELLRSRGVEVEVVKSEECVEMMREFIAAKPELWNEDIGV